MPLVPLAPAQNIHVPDEGATWHADCTSTCYMTRGKLNPEEGDCEQ